MATSAEASGEEFLEFLGYSDASHPTLTTSSSFDDHSRRSANSSHSKKKSLRKANSKAGGTGMHDSSRSTTSEMSDRSKEDHPVDGSTRTSNTSTTSATSHATNTSPPPPPRSPRSNRSARKMHASSSDMHSSMGGSMKTARARNKHRSPMRRQTSRGDNDAMSKSDHHHTPRARARSTRISPTRQKSMPPKTGTGIKEKMQDRSLNENHLKGNAARKKSMSSKKKKVAKEVALGASLHVNDVFHAESTDDDDIKSEEYDTFDDDDLAEDARRLSSMVSSASRFSNSDSVMQYDGNNSLNRSFQDHNNSRNAEQRPSILKKFKGMYSSTPGHSMRRSTTTGELVEQPGGSSTTTTNERDPRVRRPHSKRHTSKDAGTRRRSSLMDHMQELFHSNSTNNNSTTESVRSQNFDDVGMDDAASPRRGSMQSIEMAADSGHRSNLGAGSGHSRSGAALILPKEDQQNKKRFMSMMMIFCGCVGLIVAIVLLVSTITARSAVSAVPAESDSTPAVEETSPPPTAAATTNPPTVAPPPVAAETPPQETEAPVTNTAAAELDLGRTIDVSQVPQTTREDALHFLVQSQSVSDVDQLTNDPESPSALALRWMSESDPAKVAVPGFDNSNEGGNNLASLYGVLQRYALAVFYFTQESTLAGTATTDATQAAVKSSEGDQQNKLNMDHHWTTGTPECQWPGVSCNTDNLVVALNLSHFALQGTLPQELFSGGALPALTSLDLSHNKMHGHLPNVPVVAATSTSSVGVDPPQVPLQHLHLNNNAFKGWINSVFALENLIQMDLSGNRMAGKIPETIASLDKLTSLKLENNRLQGNLQNMTSMPSLEHLHLDGNQFTGSVPDGMATLTNLKVLNLGHNEGLVGTIPDFIGSSLTSLQRLNLRNTGVQGAIPASLSQLGNLEELYLHGSALTGAMPEEICQRRPPDGPLEALTSDCAELGTVTCSCCSECFWG